MYSGGEGIFHGWGGEKTEYFIYTTPNARQKQSSQVIITNEHLQSILWLIFRLLFKIRTKKQFTQKNFLLSFFDLF